MFRALSWPGLRQTEINTQAACAYIFLEDDDRSLERIFRELEGSGIGP